MKTLIAVSDTHGDAAALRALKDRFACCDYAVHLGDCARDMRGLFSGNGGAESGGPQVLTVSGNCDCTDRDAERVLEVEGVKLLLTHGHRYGVKHDLTRLFYRMEETGCRYALFGHTHCAEIYREGGMTAINPGSLSLPRWGEPSYAYLTVHEGKLYAKLVTVTK